ncbi:MAG: hypothetical protein A3C85_01560 [Candidatus Doudnabacteria bacterium RIFCSPHIGHO2_02_FULL_48_21]|uniref:NYN domain-containing protein n=1 Tax=Candidatus Doudnabacteria bacterium RIFCSPLOWO2_02_FULL_48_13 TaxID=1817845 RepID=A0A1F5Q8G5_9BACT|nr:MAG: hypothetical protein A3C85_01560 [Candidatus Doudnabacteria bacterium RIFCSPHIGHO2_02_FULL_48_21]OGE98479.1 MAG: hypothetical protein A3J05_04750 [Candidatus Doudnabacteria bacterium RIFCSPLOWO2_02_FULL_48_13]
MTKIKAKIYIDGSNVFYTQKKLGWSLDWFKVKELIESQKDIIEWKYYVGLKDGDEKMRGYLKYLNAIGFTAVTKPLKRIRVSDGENHPNSQGGFIYKANFDVEMTADILLDKAKIDEIIIFSGDSDFEYLANKLKDSGRKVIVYASKRTISWELKLASSEVVYLENLERQIKRDK